MNKRQKLVQEQFLNNEEAVIKRLNQVYGKSLDDVNEKIKNLTFKIGKLQQEYDWLDDDDPEKAKIKSQIQSKIYQKQYQEQLQKQLDGILKEMQTKQFLNISDYLDTCYEDGFIGTIFDAHGQGIPIISPINQEAMVRAVQLDSKISKGLYTRLGEDVDLLKKKITAQVSRSIATGTSYAQTAKALAGYTRIGYNNAIRIARTEGHRIQTTATMDAMHVARDKGADVVKQWDATLDSKTRPSHMAVDGEIRELDDPFSNGLGFPGDPGGKAGEVINCRCALLQRARWALKEGMNPDTGEVTYTDDEFSKFDRDSNMTRYFFEVDDYKEFKKKYLKVTKAQQPPAVVLKSTPNYTSEMATKFGKAHYDALHQIIADCTNADAVELWKKYESQVRIADASYKGTAHALGDNVYVNIDNVAKGDSISTPYQTVFHECGHAIDSISRTQAPNTDWYRRHFSSAYKDGLFPQTINDEVQALVKAKDAELKALWKQHAGDVDWFRQNGYMYNWQTTIPKYSKARAYSALEKEIKAAGSKLAYGDLSDIMEGTTGGKIQCGIGHGANYWKQRTYNGVPDGLATEAFAEMLDSTFANPESLDLIKKYLPKSYSVFQDMLKELK